MSQYLLFIILSYSILITFIHSYYLLRFAIYYLYAINRPLSLRVIQYSSIILKSINKSHKFNTLQIIKLSKKPDLFNPASKLLGLRSLEEM